MRRSNKKSPNPISDPCTALKKGTTLRVYGGKNRIILEPADRDPVKEGRGLLKTKGRVLKSLIEDRKRGRKQ
jgi:hypothetical protein